MRDELLLCRCEEVSADAVRAAVKSGAASVDAVKRLTRAGKGLCQGRTCRCLIEHVLAEELGVSVSTLDYPTARPPVRALPLDCFAALDKEDDCEEHG